MANSPSPVDPASRSTLPLQASVATPLPAATGTRVHVLANGLTVLVHEDDRFPLVSIRLFVRAGSIHEAPEQAGISHLLEHMAFKGTPRRAQGRAATDIESLGGELNAATGFDATMYIVDLPAQHWAMGLDVIQDMIFNAAFDPEELESERRVILAEMDQGDDDPHRRIFKSVQERIWAGTPYARPIIGVAETVGAITRDDLATYVRSRYQPANMVLVLCGDVRTNEILDLTRELFGRLSNHDEHHSAFSPGRHPCAGMAAGRGADGPGPDIAVFPGPWRKAHFFLALPIPGLRDVHSVGLDVLAHMLGGDRTSLLYREFKYKQGIVDTISASATSLDQTGMLSIQAQLDPANVEALWSGLVNVLADLGPETFSPEALGRAKLNMEDGLFQAKETLSGLASKLGYFQFHEYSFEAEQVYLHMIKTMDPEQLREVIRAHVRPDRLVCSIFTPNPEALPVEGLSDALARKWQAASSIKPGFPGIASCTARHQPEIVHLAPGRSVVLLPDSSLPYMALTMCWNGGDLLLPDRDQGLSELTARVWTKGTRSKNAVQAQDFLADRAARVAAGAGLEQFYLNLHFPVRFRGEMLSFFQELVQEPAWLPEELARAKQEQCAAIVRTEDSPVGLALRNTFPFLFSGHPYGYQRSGAPDTVAAFTRDQVVDFWERQKDRPWVLAACGDLDREALLAMAESLTRRDVMAAPTPRSPRWGGEQKLALQLQDRNQTHLLMVFPLPGLGSEHTPGLNLLREVLAGQSGLLFRELRDVRGLAYSVTALLWQETLAGFLAFYIGTSPENEEAAIQGFQDVVHDLIDRGLPEEELDRAKNLLWGDYQRSRQRLIARAHDAAENLTRGFSLDHSLEMIEQAGQTTPHDLAALVREYLRWDQAYLIKVRP